LDFSMSTRRRLANVFFLGAFATKKRYNYLRIWNK